MIFSRDIGAIYLASPFSDPDEAVRNERHSHAKLAVAHLLNAGAWVYSPIAMSGDLYQSLPKTWEFWKPVSIGMMLKMDALLVLTLPGWGQSQGVTAEITTWKRQPLIQDPPGKWPMPYFLCPDSYVITVRPMPARVAA